MKINRQATLLLLIQGLIHAQSAPELYQSGLRLFAEGQFDASIKLLQQSVAMQPDDAVAWKALGVVLASKGDFERAETPFRQACERQPALEDACLYHGRTLYLRDRFQIAIPALRQALKLKEGSEPHRLLGLSLEAMGRSAEAGGEFLAALRFAAGASRDEDPGIDYGVYLYRLGRTEESLEPLNAALQRQPNSGRTHLELGCVLLALDRVSDAASHLERSLAIAPNSARAHLLLGKAYLRLGRTADAEPHLRLGADAHLSRTSK